MNVEVPEQESKLLIQRAIEERPNNFVKSDRE